MRLLGNLILLSGVFILLSYGTWMALEAYLGHLDSMDSLELAGYLGLGAVTCLLGSLLRR